MTAVRFILQIEITIYVVLQALVKAAPQELLPGLKKDLTRILSVLPALEDRPKTLVAIEFLIALIGSGTIFGKLSTRNLRRLDQASLTLVHLIKSMMISEIHSFASSKGNSLGSC